MAIAHMYSDKKQDYLDIKIRPLAMSEADDCMEWLTDEKIGKFWEDIPIPSKEAAMQYLEEEVFPGPWYKAICLNDKPIGLISVTPSEGEDKCTAELGYVVAPKYWGKGIATKAVKMVASKIFLEWPHLKRLEACVDVENLGSQKVLEKAGFRREGVLNSYFFKEGEIPRDMITFSLLHTDKVVVSRCNHSDSPTKLETLPHVQTRRRHHRLDSNDCRFFQVSFSRAAVKVLQRQFFVFGSIKAFIPAS